MPERAMPFSATSACLNFARSAESSKTSLLSSTCTVMMRRSGDVAWMKVAGSERIG